MGGLNTQKKNLILKIEDKTETLDNINKYNDQMIKIDQIIKDYNEKIQNLDTKIPNIQNIDKENIINPFASPSAGAPALKYGYVNTETPSPGEVKGLINIYNILNK